mmetsp:Transcript_72057/g.64741  ORF Transcript_72057/g.64741 Transcript_72057/m.64741 type:complete len:410 (-) Transcript_72057:166-1395(-)
MLWLLVLITLNYGAYAQSDKDQFCPLGDGWKFCVKEKTNVQTCSIPGNIGRATISYGYNNGKHDTAFSFYDISHTDSQGAFEFGCSDGRLGDPAKGWKGCCYRQGPIDYNYSLNAADWEIIAGYDGAWKTDGMKLVKYVKSGSSQSFYRWMNGLISCNEDYFPYWDQSKSDKEGNRCYQLENYPNYKSSGFIPCGQNGGECDVPDINADSMSLVAFGSGGAPWTMTWAYSSTGAIQCSKTMFLGSGGEYCDIQNRTVFPNSEVIGTWEQQWNCDGCTGGKYAITEGTTAQSPQAGKPSWVTALGDVVSAGITFLGGKLASDISGAISDLAEPSYTHTETMTCEAQCGNGTAADWHIYQWVMSTDEYVDMDPSSFNINACQYICNSEAIPPKCPPGYCADFACQTCTSYN